MFNQPEVRPHPRAFTLGFVRREMRLEGKTPMAGLSAMIIFGKRDQPRFRLLFHFHDWRIQRSIHFDNLDELLRVTYYELGISLDEWRGCHPAQGVALYGKPRSKIEKLHRMWLGKWQDKLNSPSVPYYRRYWQLVRDDYGLKQVDLQFVSYRYGY